MKLNSRIAILLLACASGAVCERIPGIPDDFTAGYLPHSGTAWYTDGNARAINGGKECLYFGTDTLPSQYSRSSRTRSCPGITVRHLVQVRIGRAGGKCTGFSCAYDYAIPSQGFQMTMHSMEYCPDLVFTAVVDGKMTIIGGKTFRRGDDPSVYYRGRQLLAQSFVSEPALVEKCTDPERYNRQLDFWFGDTPAGLESSDGEYDDPLWDGN